MFPDYLHLAGNKTAYKINKSDTAAKTKAERVHISCILLRTDKRVNVTKIDTLNQMLVMLTNEESVHFVNNDTNFRYRDESPDTSVLLPGDELHLTAIGTKLFLANLGLADMATSYLSKGPSSRWPNSKPATVYHEAQYNTRMPNTYTSMAPPTVKMHQIAHHNAGMPGCYVQGKTSDAQQTARRSLPQQLPSVEPMAQKRSWPGIKNLPHIKKRRYFRGEHDPLSNYHMVNLRVFGNIFQSLEHAYQRRKAMYIQRSDVAIHIMKTTTAAHAKQIADDKLDTRNTNW